MFLDAEAGDKPVLQILTAAGKLVSQRLWRDAEPVAIAWSLDELLLVAQKNGYVSTLDLNGKNLKAFNMGQEAENRGIVQVKFFLFENNTGVAVLTGGRHIYIVNDINSPRVKRIADVPNLTNDSLLWEIIPAPLDLRDTRSTESIPGPWAIVVRNNHLYRADFNTVNNVDLSSFTRSASIHLLSVSPDCKFVALYLDDGRLLVTNLRFTELHSQVDLTQKLSDMMSLAADTVLRPVSTKLIHPIAMMWCTCAAVVLKLNQSIALIGAQGDVNERFYSADVHLSQELDGVRLVTPTAHMLLQRVPPALESLGSIGSHCPATWLLMASTSLQAGSERAADYLGLIQSGQVMREAVAHCLEAACHATLDSDCQRNLLAATHMGQTLLLAGLFTEPLQAGPQEDNGNGSTAKLHRDVRKTADSAAMVCKTLRVLNSLAVPWIGIALTWSQFLQLGTGQLLQRLLARHHYPAAICLAGLLADRQVTEPSGDQAVVAKDPSVQASSRSRSRQASNPFTGILTHWACHNRNTAGAGDDRQLAERLAAVVRRLKEASEASGLSVDFCEAANAVLAVDGHAKMAQLLSELETRPWKQVPLLLKLDRPQRALVKSVETGDPELIAIVVEDLQKKMRPADLSLLLRRHPIAMAIHEDMRARSRFASAVQTTVSALSQEDDRATEAKRLVLSAYRETNLSLRIASLLKAEEIYKQIRNDFMAQQCKAAISLLHFQKKLESQGVQAPVFSSATNTKASFPGELGSSVSLALPSIESNARARERLWMGESVNTTLGRLLTAPQCERYAGQLRRELGVSEKRFAHLRLIGLAVQNDCWAEMDKMIKEKRPLVSLETMIKICIDGNRFEEALKIIPRLPASRRVRFLLLAGRVEEAIQTAVRERSDADLCLIQEQVGKVNRTVKERVAALRLQLQ